MLQCVVDTILKETRVNLGVRDVPDKDPTCTGKHLVYVNYASAREAKNTSDILTFYVNDICPVKGLVVMIKQDMYNHSYSNTPTGT